MSTTKLRVIDGGVKESATARGGFFLPHLKLMARAHRLPLSPAAIVLLMHLLEGAGKPGRGEGCRPEEAMVARRNRSLAHAMGCSQTALKRTKRELRAIVRTVRVNAKQPKPRYEGKGDEFTGKTAEAPFLVYFVDLRAIGRLLEVDYERQAENAAHAGAPVAASPAPASSPADAPAPAELLAAYWVERIGGPRRALPTTTTRVRRALRSLLELGTLEEHVRDVIDGASDPELGGKAYGYVDANGLWDERLFMAKSGPSKAFDHVFKAVLQTREAEREKQARKVRELAANDAPFCARHGSRCRTPEACQERSQARK